MNLNEELRGVELHIHLDGAVRADTLYNLALRRNLVGPSRSHEEFRKSLIPTKPYKLANFLEPFKLILLTLAGDKEAIMQVAEECVEDCVLRSKLCYVELRFAPHLLTGPGLDSDAVTRAVLEAVKISSRRYGIQVRLLLCVLRQKPETAEEVLELAIKYRDHGVVGIDVSGDDATWRDYGLSPKIIGVFKEAHKRHIHRTVHAGENSPAEAVLEAVSCLHAERIGHGYSVIQQPEIYEWLRNTPVHFEVCPTSSVMTGGVNLKSTSLHPVVQFAKDNVKYSINTDGPLMTGRWLQEEYQYCLNELGLTARDLEVTKLNAAKAAFLDEEEDHIRLIEHIQSGMGSGRGFSTF
ncbi:Adenosine deaminase [Fasciola hepatica]|uniref:adenosine deaminase n=1 Tax=Fasciola hepatica TaxID=6192 RepID=A0A4E0RHP4_FASHE|nr:Adenosine deaminase [Fasciola hepatica]